MTQSDIVSKLAETSGASKVTTKAIIDGFAEIIAQDVLKGSGSVNIPGLGTFKRKVSAARVGRNPSTGASVNIPEKTKINFKMSSSLK